MKLAKLPERTPVRLTVGISPDLNQALARYAEFYRETYVEEATATELVPAIVAAFLQSDKAFVRWCKDGANPSS